MATLADIRFQEIATNRSTRTKLITYCPALPDHCREWQNVRTTKKKTTWQCLGCKKSGDGGHRYLYTSTSNNPRTLESDPENPQAGPHHCTPFNEFDTLNRMIGTHARKAVRENGSNCRTTYQTVKDKEVLKMDENKRERFLGATANKTYDNVRRGMNYSRSTLHIPRIDGVDSLPDSLECTDIPDRIPPTDSKYIESFMRQAISNPLLLLMASSAAVTMMLSLTAPAIGMMNIFTDNKDAANGKRNPKSSASDEECSNVC